MKDVSPALARFADREFVYWHDLDEGTVLAYVMRHRRTFMLVRCIDPDHQPTCWKASISTDPWGQWERGHTSDYGEYYNPLLQAMAEAAIAAIPEEVSDERDYAANTY
jgi:hypothetical protein